MSDRRKVVVVFLLLTISSPSLSFFLAVEDNVTEEQHSPGQSAIPSGNTPFHI